MNIHKIYVMGLFFAALLFCWLFTFFLASEDEWGKAIFLGFTAACGSIKWWQIL